MPVPSFDMYTFSGVFGSVASPVEIWSFTIKQEPLQGTPAASAAAARAAYANLTNILQPTTILTNVRFSKHAAGGKVQVDSQGAYIQADSPGASPGTLTGGPVWPLQTALCVSLLTGRAGASGKGRFFLPAPAFTLGSDYRWSAANRDTITNAVEVFLGQLNLPEGPLVVASSKGFRSAVTSFRIGRVPDTQRSRRGNLLEDYIVRAVPA